MQTTVNIPPRRAFTQPLAGETWDSLAKRLFPEEPVEQAIQKLQSWNLFLAFRPGGGGMTPSDIVFVEAPRAA